MKKKRKKIRPRDPCALPAKMRKGAGPHKNKKHKENKDLCRKKVEED